MHQQHAFMAKAGIDSLKISQSANEETGTDEEQERPRHLCSDECGGETAARSQRRPPAAFQGKTRAYRGRANRRRKCKQQPGESTYSQSEDQDLSIQANGESDRMLSAGDEPQQQGAAELSYEQPERGAHQRKKKALRQKLANDTSATGADRVPNGDFTAARRRASQQEVCDVGAGYE